jgi:UDP:flavonoid glycosyltransferase YjiC (YdhE family)
VVVAASPNTLDLPRACGFEALPFGPDSQELMDSEQGQRWLASGNVTAFTKALTEISHQSFDRSVQEAERAVAGADVVIGGLLAEDLSVPMAQRAGAVAVTAHSVPVRRTSAYPHPLVTTARLPGWANSLTGRVFDTVWWRGNKADVNAYRAEAGLPPGRPLAALAEAEDLLELQMYDAGLVPGLRWDARRPLTGFLSPGEEIREAIGETGLATDLVSWLEDGDRPVLFGFGSMPVQDPAATVALIADVSRALGVRALVTAGWARLTALDPGDPAVRVVGPVDHSAVMPRCAAVVHHGGAGTTAASVGAGIPTVVCSVFADQPFWGARVEDAGVGTHLRFRELDRDQLEMALRAALEPAVRERAAVLGGRLVGPDSAVRTAADAVEARMR